MCKSIIVTVAFLLLTPTLSQAYPRVTKAEIVFTGFQHKLNHIKKWNVGIDLEFANNKAQHDSVLYIAKSKYLIETNSAENAKPDLSYLRIGDKLYIIDHVLNEKRYVSSKREPTDLLGMMRGYPQFADTKNISKRSKYEFDYFNGKASVVKSYSVDGRSGGYPCKTTYHVALDQISGQPLGWTAEMVIGNREVNRIKAVYCAPSKSARADLSEGTILSYRNYKDLNRADNLTSLKVGSPFPDCLLPNIKGGLISLYTVAKTSKACLLVIWYPGGHEYGYKSLSVEFPDASRIRSRFNVKGLEIVAICLSTDRKIVLDHLQKTKLAFPLAYLRQPAGQFGLKKDSIVVLVDRQRTIKWVGNDFYWDEIMPKLKAMGISN